MRAEAVVELLDAFDAAGLRAWIDGGWGVDALLGSQSREHDDLDLVVEMGSVAQIRSLLGSRGFELSEDEMPVRFVMAHSRSGRIDFHPVTFDGGGGGLQVQPDGRTFRYPPEGFCGRGSILSRPVACLTPEVQVLCHIGYEPDEKDVHDVLLLHRTFGVKLPRAYGRFAGEGSG